MAACQLGNGGPAPDLDGLELLEENCNSLRTLDVVSRWMQLRQLRMT
jgi:hypothetical protein